ncbi:MAG TPA: hypothetical protein VHE54_06225 [Puia sp.]|nr:hypothetical protein [Puia sp.]
MKNILICASILLMTTSAIAQNTLTSHLPPTTAALIAGATVSVLNDQTILVRYSEKGVAYKSFYSKDGAWLHTVASYEQALLPAPVKHVVNSAWRGWDILYVDEVRTPGVDPVYQIQLRRAGNLTIVRVSGEAIETERQLSIQ